MAVGGSLKRFAWRAAALGLILWGVSGCQGGAAIAPLPEAAPPPGSGTHGAEAQPRLSFPAPDAWGGEVRCGGGQCRLALVEHEAGFVVLHRFEGRKLRELARAKLAYHPDSATWLDGDLLVTAVEAGGTLDVFRTTANGLQRLAQLPMNFAPREALVLGGTGGVHHLLAVPYSGDTVAWLRWRQGAATTERLQRSVLCKAPWHPVAVARAPKLPAGGIAVGCLDDRRVMWAAPPDAGLPTRELARFDAVPRQVQPSPSGRWLYVALETGGRNARIDMDTGAVQFVPSPIETGVVAVAPLTDDLVAWSADGRIYLQQLDAAGAVLQTRWLATSGFGTGLQLIDVDGDGQQDLLVLNSAGRDSDVIFGPLWEHAQTQQP